LAYLKLVASHLDKVIIVKGALGSLRHLFIEVEIMTELKVQEGALPLLESLRLLCKDLNGCGTIIQSLRRIKEVVLHDGVSDETKHKWKEAAKNHPRHPKLLFVKTDEEVHMGSETADNSESPMVPTTETKLCVSAPHDGISTGHSGNQVLCILLSLMLVLIYHLCITTSTPRVNVTFFIVQYTLRMMVCSLMMMTQKIWVTLIP
jgi:disease resistance protein RPM1